MLAEVDPEKLRCFLEAHPVDDWETMAWREPAGNSPEVHVVRRENWTEGESSDVKEEPFEEHALNFVRKAIGNCSLLSGYSEEECRLAKDQSLAYVEGSAARTEVKRFVSGYLALSGEHEQGDAFRSLIADMAADIDNIRMRRVNYHHVMRLDTLCKALAFGTEIVFKPKFKGLGKKKAIVISYCTPLTSVRRRMLAGLLAWLMGFGALSKWLKSDAVPLWRDAYLKAFEMIGGPNASNEHIKRPFQKNDIDEIIGLIKKAYGIMFADAAMSNAANQYWGAVK